MLIPTLFKAGATAMMVAAVAAGCGAAPAASASPIIDTWPVGDEFPCQLHPETCRTYIPVAVRGFDERDPGHGEVLDVVLHYEGGYLDPASGNVILPTRSGGCCLVAVIHLPEDEIRAIGVGKIGISDVPQPVPWGP